MDIEELPIGGDENSHQQSLTKFYHPNPMRQPPVTSKPSPQLVQSQIRNPLKTSQQQGPKPYLSIVNYDYLYSMSHHEQTMFLKKLSEFRESLIDGYNNL